MFSDVVLPPQFRQLCMHEAQQHSSNRIASISNIRSEVQSQSRQLGWRSNTESQQQLTMSALETLSVASNVFQIIGFADTVFRAGKSLYELFDKARSASRNIAWLLIELQALLRVVAHVRVVIAEHASSPFAQDDGHTLPNVEIVLTLIEQDFRHLTGLLGQTVGSGSEGWLSLLQRNIRWALNDHQIAASRQRFAQYTQNLTLALTVSGRYVDIAN
jgi:hypothetical protein